jgi:hypothetical protein
MARSTTKRKNSKQIIEEAAEVAANLAVEELDDETNFEDDGIELNFDPAEVAIDVFEEGFKKAIAVKDAPRYYIKKNSQFLTVKDYPYSWEQLQKEYGPGWYQVQCKARSNGRILKSQTEMVGDPNEGKPVQIEEEVLDTMDKTDNLAILGYLQQSQERADQRAREAARQAENNTASMMQSFVQMMVENSKQNQALMLEQSRQSNAMFMTMLQQNQTKGPDPILNLLTTMITQGKKDDGFTYANVLKMVQDAENRGEQRATKNFELIEKKSSELAEIKIEAGSSSSEESESLTKSLLKGLVPIWTQAMANQNQVPGVMPNQPVPTLGATQDYMTQQSLRPAISGPNRPQVANVPTAQRAAQPVIPPRPQVVQAPVLTTQQKQAIFEYVGLDIGQSMLQRSQASTTAQEVISKLEIKGISRQTIAKGFVVEDFYAFAEPYVPQESLAEARAWLKEFHEAIQGLAVQQSKPNTTTVVDGESTKSKQTVSAKRSQTVVERTRTQPREATKNQRADTP